MGYQLECTTDIAEADGSAAVVHYRPPPLLSSAVSSSSVSGIKSVHISDTVLASDAATGRLRAHNIAVDSALVSDSVSGVRRLLLSDAAQVSDSVGGVRRVPALADFAIISDAISGRVRTVGHLADRATVSDAAPVRRRAGFSDVAQVSDAVALYARLFARVSDSAQVSDSWQLFSRAAEILRDEARITDAVFGRLTAYGLVSDVVAASGYVPYTGAAEAWITCTATGGVSYWVGGQVRRAVFWRGKLTLATGDGLMRVDGTDDVPTVVETPWMDFGSDQKKRVAAVYLDGGSDVAKVTASTSNLRGDLAEGVYPAVQYRNGMTRAVAGRGLEGRYWRFKITSAKSHEIRAVSLDSALSNRRL